MSRSQPMLKQELHYESGKSKESGWQHGQCSVYRVAPDKVVFEVSEEPSPRKDLSQIRSVDLGKHENILRITTTDDIKYLHFDSRSDMMAWRNTIKGFMKTCDMTEVDFVDDVEEGRPRAQSFKTRPREREPDPRKAKSSPATPGDMFREMIHSKNDEDLTPVSPDPDSPIYVNANFSQQLLDDRDAYIQKDELTALQEENYQPLLPAQDGASNIQHQEDETYCPPADVFGDDAGDYEDMSIILPSEPLPLSSKQGKPRGKPPQKAPKPKMSGITKHLRRLTTRDPKPQKDTKEKKPEKESSPLRRLSTPQQPDSDPASQTRTGSSISSGSISRPGSLHSQDQIYHDTREEGPLPIDPPAVEEQIWTKWRQPSDREKTNGTVGDEKDNEKRGKDRPPMPPPKNTKPIAQVSPHAQERYDEIYSEVPIEYSIGSNGLELEAKCEVRRDLQRSVGSVTRCEEKLNVRIPVQEYRVGDITLINQDGKIIIERTNISYLKAGDQLLQIGDINVEHLGKDIANACLGNVSTNEIKLVILRRYP